MKIEKTYNQIVLTNSTSKPVQKKSSHQYNENGLHDINVTWQPRGVDWNAHV